MSNKTHYRKVYKSDHLGVVDLEEFLEAGSNLVFTIKNATQGREKVAGKSIDCNIIYFKESIKPMVVNATNGKQIAKFAGSGFVEDWKNIPIQLYIDKSVKMKGDVVGGIRIRPSMPAVTLQELTPVHEQWGMAIDRVKGGMTLEQMRGYYSITDSNWEALCSQAK